MIGFNPVSSAPHYPMSNSHDYIQRISRLQQLAGRAQREASASTTVDADNDAPQLAAKMLEAQIESLQNQLSNLPSRQGSTAGYDSGADIIAPIADGINRPTATNQVNVYI